jgi:2-phospho-L-lactate guanylyltransferase (CobY/MobA/RfbA family)
VRDVDTDADLRAAVALGAGPRTTALLDRLRMPGA